MADKAFLNERLLKVGFLHLVYVDVFDFTLVCFSGQLLAPYGTCISCEQAGTDKTDIH